MVKQGLKDKIQMVTNEEMRRTRLLSAIYNHTKSKSSFITPAHCENLPEEVYLETELCSQYLHKLIMR